MNQATILGRIGQDPESKEVTGGNTVTQLSVATNDYAGKDKDDEVNWHRCVFWGKQAEAVAKYTKKGDQVMVQGRIRYRSYEDKEGNKKYVTEIIASKVEFLGKKESTNQPDSDEVPF